MGLERGPGAERGLVCPSATWKAAVNPSGQRQMLGSCSTLKTGLCRSEMLYLLSAGPRAPLPPACSPCTTAKATPRKRTRRRKSFPPKAIPL